MNAWRTTPINPPLFKRWARSHSDFSSNSYMNFALSLHFEAMQNQTRYSNQANKDEDRLHFIAYLQKLNLYISIYHKFVKIYEVLTAS